MHEWALTDAVVETAESASREAGMKSVSEVVVVLGELQGIDKGIFISAYDQMKKNYPRLKKSRIVLENEDVELHCHGCDRDFKFQKDELDHQTSEAIHFLPEVARVYIRCPECGSGDFSVVKGRGFYIKEIRGER